MPYYAVRVGRKPGIYGSWSECNAQVSHFPYARFKKFSTESEAQEFVGSTGLTKGISKQSETKFKAKQDPPGNFLARSRVKAGKLKGALKSLAFLESPSVSNQASSKEELLKANCDSENRDCAIVYTDGACSSNGQQNACAGIGVYWGDDDPRNVSEKLIGRQTNNSAEIRAAVKAVVQAKIDKFKSIKIRTDSQFMIDSMTNWIRGWINRQWRTATGMPVKNKEDFEALLEASKGINVIYEKVSAHSGDLCNDAADSLAVEGAKK